MVRFFPKSLEKVLEKDDKRAPVFPAVDGKGEKEAPSEALPWNVRLGDTQEVLDGQEWEQPREQGKVT